MYKQDLALDNLQGLICHKNTTNPSTLSYDPYVTWISTASNVTLTSEIQTYYLDK